MLSDRELDSIKLTERQIFALMKLYKRDYQKRPFVLGDLKRVGATRHTLTTLERRGFTKYTKCIAGWRITANGRQLAETYDDRLIDL